MITEPISFTGKLTLQDSLDLDETHFRCVLRWPVRVLMAVFSALIAALVVAVSIKSGFRLVSYGILFVCAYFPFGWLLHRRLEVAWRFRRYSDKLIENTAIFTNDDITVSNALSDNRLSWECLDSVVSTPRGLLFMIPSNLAWFYLPKRLFDGNSYKDSILELAEEHEIKIHQLS